MGLSDRGGSKKTYLFRRMVDAANFALLDEVLDQLPAKHNGVGTQRSVGQLGRFAVAPSAQGSAIDSEDVANFFTR
jgi:hypothetical protein